MEKPEWRKLFLAARGALSAFERASFSSFIHRRIVSHPVWQQARTVGAYISLPDEVQTRPLLRQAWQRGKQIVAPAVDQHNHTLTFHRLSRMDEMRWRSRGPLEPPRTRPVAQELIDLVLVPGVGFDERGYRLGFGKGYYDRFLGSCRAFRMGLAFEAQLTGVLPTSAWDTPVDCIVTEKRFLPLTAV